MNNQTIVLKGSALAYGIVIMTVVSIIMTSILSFITQQTKLSLQVHATEQAFQIAESGIQFYRWYLAHQVEGRTTQQIQNFWDSGSAYGVGTPFEREYTDPGGNPIGKFRLEVTPPETGYTAVTVRATGWTYRYPSNPRVIEVRFRKPSWSEYAVLTNEFTRFGVGTEIFGKVHSNYGIRFDGLAHNIVTSAVNTYNDPDHSGGDEFGVHTHVSPTDPLPPASVPDRTDVFEVGRSMGVATKDFNGVLGDFAYMKNQAQNGVNGSKYFDDTRQGWHIILNSNGTFSIRNVRSFSTGDNEINQYQGGWSTYTIPDEGVIFVENNVWLEGTVNGKRVTIVAANLQSAALKNIYIGKDIRYTNYDCSDMVGILAQGDVEIYKNSNDVLRIDGALVAQSGRVGRQFYQGANDSFKDTITLYGAIASSKRYGFAWVDSNGNHVGGYANRNLYFDNNLLYCPPPYYPTGTQYEQDLWQEQ